MMDGLSPPSGSHQRLVAHCQRFQINIQSRHPDRTVRTHLSAYALALGARDGILTVSMPAAPGRRLDAGRVGRRFCGLRPVECLHVIF